MDKIQVTYTPFSDLGVVTIYRPYGVNEAILLDLHVRTFENV
jgi:hypothetical protein